MTLFNDAAHCGICNYREDNNRCRHQRRLIFSTVGIVLMQSRMCDCGTLVQPIQMPILSNPAKQIYQQAMMKQAMKLNQSANQRQWQCSQVGRGGHNWSEHLCDTCYSIWSSCDGCCYRISSQVMWCSSTFNRCKFQPFLPSSIG